KSSPGFLVNRALTPYMLEAMVLLDENIDKRVIDRAAENFGMPMGPIELADQVGLDICLDVGDMLRSKFGDELPPTPAWLRGKVARGAAGAGIKIRRPLHARCRLGEFQVTDTQAVHVPLNMENEPCGDLCTRTLAMPADTNANGDIFGGWLLSQMDIGGGVFASKL